VELGARYPGARVATLGIWPALWLVAACGHGPTDQKLSKPAEEDVGIPNVPPPPENGPRLGALANVTPIFDRPSLRGGQLGYLHAGETVPRAAEPFSTPPGCKAGFYPIFPSGFVCAESTATVDLGHPTLTAMAIQPKLEGPLPYTYARTVRDTTLYELDPEREDRVRPSAPLRAKSGMAVVGSWGAADPNGKPLRLAMMTDGHFVPAADLEALAAPRFEGSELGDRVDLPMAFVVKRGVHAWAIADDDPDRRAALDYHARVALTGHFRKIGDAEFWATTDKLWVREKDVTLVRERHDFPAFADGEQKWIDVSVVTGTLVAYEGKKPIFATLVSVGRDRLGAPESDAVTRRGELQVTGKHVSLAGRDPSTFADGVSIYDAPWALELSSGQYLLGAYWHDRFGIEHGPGNIELSPADAARLFRWADPVLPAGWHGVNAKPADKPSTLVNVRK
jgi:hypothetical protein